MIISDKKIEKLEHSKAKMTATVPAAEIGSVYDEMMSSPTVEKWYFTPGKMGSVVKINSDPAVRQAIRDYKLKQEKERKAKGIIVG